MTSRWGNRPDAPILASLNYNPASTVTPTTVSTSYVDVDATNLAVTFTAPQTGHVRVTGSLYACNQTSGQVIKFGLRDGSTDVAGSGQSMTSGNLPVRMAYAAEFSGLTPGQTYTWKLSWKVVGGTGQISYGGTDVGPVSMLVQAMP